MLHSLLLIVALHFSPHRADAPAAVTPTPAAEPAIKLPAKLTGKPGALIPIKADTPAELVTWFAPQGVTFAQTYPADPSCKSMFVHVPADTRAGTVFVIWGSIPNGKAVAADRCEVTIEGKPDDKTPVVDPPITDKAPIPVPGFRVLIVYETADLPKYPKGQLAVLYGGEVRGYLSSKCVKGDDGKTAEWRIWDANVVTAGESNLWQEAMRRPRGKLPSILISDGVKGYEGPLPDSIADTLALLKRFGN